MRKEDYVSYETAKLLKEKGFDEYTRFVWYERLPHDLAVFPGTAGKPGIDLYYGTKETENDSPFNNKDKAGYISGDVCCCPTLQDATWWLRMKHNLHVVVDINKGGENDSDGSIVFYTFRISNTSGDVVYDSLHEQYIVEYNSFECACDDAVRHCLENLI